MLPFSLSSDEPSDLPLVRPVNEAARSVRTMVKLYVGQARRSEEQRETFKRDLVGGLPHLDDATLLDLATDLCVCPDIDFATALTLMERSDAVARLFHAEAVFLHENYLISIAKRGHVELAAAIALRTALSHPLLVALVERDETLIDTALASNPAVLLPRDIRRTLQMRGRFDSNIAGALLRRRDVQPLERLPLLLRGDPFARARLIAECAPLLAPSLRPAHADRPLPARLAAFDEARLGRYVPLAEFLGLDPAYVETLCQDRSGEPLALLCAASELRGFDVLAVLTQWPTQPARQAGRLSALSDIATGILPGIALALLIRMGAH